METFLPRIAAGDPDAVRECIDHYGGLLWSIARRFHRSTEEAEDSVQEAFVAVWKNAAKFDPSLASEKTFVTMIARRKMIDRLRKEQRRPQWVDLPPEVEIEPADDEHVRMQASVEAQVAAEILHELRPEQRRVLELSIYYGMTHSEIANSVDLPLGTVKSHIFRGLNKVRERLTSLESQAVTP